MPYLRAHQAALEMKEDVAFYLEARGKNPQLTEADKAAGNALSGVPWDALVRPWHLYLKNALGAQRSFHQGEHYIVQEYKVVIVDEFTGRAHEERSWQHGLHQAVAAKEGVGIPHSRQRYFLSYDNLAGLTGTGMESKKEFHHFFKLPIRAIEPNRPNLRKVMLDRVYKKRDAMLKAVAQNVAEHWHLTQPVLIGTRIISISEALAAILAEQGILHRVLNAKQNKEENEIIAAAGELGSVVVATNMAGRGTHISLPKESLAYGGLHVIGVE